jgi:hypothetical protein
LIKNTVKYGLLSWALVGLLLCGCAQVTRVITAGCAWMDDAYVAIATGAVPAAAPIIAQAKAWLGAADLALSVLGAVQKRICADLGDILNALAAAQSSLPKLEIPTATLTKMRSLTP